MRKHNWMEKQNMWKMFRCCAFFFLVLSVCFWILPQKTSASEAELTGTLVEVTGLSEEELEDLLEEYSSRAYMVVNDNEPFFEEADYQTESFENYSKLDSKGRCGVAYANVGQDLMPNEPRGAIGSIKPSGWHTVKYNDLIDGNYLYNRCHLIGYQLTGENANEKNLITGTRYLNTIGMLPFETLVAEYVEATDNHVLYRVTPVYEDDNLVASGVLMEGWSVEDEGKGICFNVFCYNMQPGISIDYKTGDSKECGEKIDPALFDAVCENAGSFEGEKYSGILNEDTATKETTMPDDDKDSESFISDEPSTTVHYIGNLNTKKFHYPSCSSVDDMSEKNKKEITGSHDDAVSMGFVPCQRCNP